MRHIIVAEPELDAASGADVRASCVAIAMQGEDPVIDAEAVQSWTTAGLHAWTEGAREALERGHQLHVQHASDALIVALRIAAPGPGTLFVFEVAWTR